MERGGMAPADTPEELVEAGGRSAALRRAPTGEAEPSPLL